MKTLNRNMRARLIFILVCGQFLPAARARADTGWSTEYRADTGPIYSATEHPDIVLEKEVLLYNNTAYAEWAGGGSAEIEAHFLFRNTSGREVTVQAAFPVKTAFPVSISPFDPPGGQARFNWDVGPFFVEKLLGVAAAADEFGEEGVILGPKRLVVQKSVSTSTVYGISALNITQDGKQVPVDSCFLRTEFSPPYSDANPGTDPKYVGTALVGELHYLHKLVFPARALSRVVFRYDQLVLAGQDGGDREWYQWRYVLGTARTWRGPVGRLFVSIPNGIDPKLPPEFSKAGVWSYNTLYLASNYKPGEKDEISMHRSTRLRPSPGPYAYEDPPVIYQATSPAQAFVTIPGNSSALAGGTTVYLPDPDVHDWGRSISKTELHPYSKNFETPNIERIYSSGFGPLALFDGLRESAWCEGADGDGIGEWVDFRLAEDVNGLEISNGFRKYSPELETSPRKAYEDNARVRTLEIAPVKGGEKLALELKDTEAPQVFETARLPKGEYRLKITGVYPGRKYRDACLGEIAFRISDDFLFPVLKSGSSPW